MSGDGILLRHPHARNGLGLGLFVILADDVVAAVALGRIEAFVGALDQERRVVLRPQHGDADGNGHAPEPLAGRALHQFLGHHRVADLVGDDLRGVERRIGQRNDEFLAAVARGDIAVFDVLLHRQRHQAQHLVAGEVAKSVVECLEVVDVGHQQRQRLAPGRRFADALGERGIEIFAVGERRQRIGEAFVANRLEIVLQLLDLLARRREPRFELAVARLHFIGALHQMLDHGAQRVAVVGLRELLARGRQALRIAARRSRRGVDRRHDLLDLVEHARADGIDALAETGVGNVGVVDLVEIGFAQRAILRQRFVDLLIERLIVAGRVMIPDFKIARRGRLAQCLDLPERGLREGERPFVLVCGHVHRLSPIALGIPNRRPAEGRGGADLQRKTRREAVKDR